MQTLALMIPPVSDEPQMCTKAEAREGVNILIFNCAGILLLLGALTVLVFGAGSDGSPDRPDAAIVVWAGWGVIGAAAVLAGCGLWRVVA
jgi:hypothetical protein